jgi:glucose/arabinose dehydrogenase
MKLKNISVILLAAILLAACSTAPAEEAAAQPAMQEASAPNDDTEAASPAMEEEAAPATDMVSFSMDIMPVLVEFAQPAHGTQGEGGVFLETYDDVMKYVMAGDPENSELYKRLTGDGVDIMPPSGKLPDATIQLFYDWIAQGALNN